MSFSILESRKSFASLTFGAIVLAALSSCSTMKVEKSEVESVKKVAIVGFELQEQIPPSLEKVLLGTDKQGSVGGGLKVAHCTNTNHADVVRKDLADELAKQMGWKVSSGDLVAKASGYEPIYQEYTNGVQIAQPVPDQYECYTSTGTLDPFSIEKLGVDRRRELMRSLGVDAVATATFDIQVENKSFLKQLVAAGDLASQSTMKFKLYTASSENPVWFDLNAKGEETKETTSTAVGITDEHSLHQQAVKASHSAIEALIARYKNQG